ncbi:MAG: 4-hydroxy-tetrahydrodipicolinate reductase [Proteobacteria bacterium]|nr:4-hydroxy-tetrahydrodipicolinate reductase [Pseudomonadota bacterium]
MTIKLCLAGATGWAGSELARAIAACDDIELVSAVSRSQAGRRLGDVLDEPRLACYVHASVEAALDAAACDVFFDYTRADAARSHVRAALERGAQVVVGTSGLSDEDYARIDTLARERGRGVLACGNFALTVVLLQKFAEMAARLIPHWEIIDYAHDGKADAPSGTARELAARLGRIRHPQATVPIEATVGPREARGATLSGTQVHSLRLPGHVIGAEAIFGLPDEKLSIRHDAGASARPYVNGAVLAIRGVASLVGVHRGLDTVLPV